jgi:cobalt-zinc-cadmium resistance protein CzcA
MAMVRALLRSVPEVGTIISKAGRPEDGTDPKLINMAELFIDLKPENQWRPGMTKRKIIDEMDRLLDRVPGTDASFSQPIRDNVLESISQVDGQIVIKLFGEDPLILREQAEKALAAIRGVRGVERSFIDRLGELPQVQIQIDRERAARYGLNVADIQDVIETGLGGKAATQIWEGEKRFGGDSRHSRQHGIGTFHPSVASGHVQDRRRRHEHQPRKRHPSPGDQRVHKGSRHG